MIFSDCGASKEAQGEVKEDRSVVEPEAVSPSQVSSKHK